MPECETHHHACDCREAAHERTVRELQAGIAYLAGIVARHATGEKNPKYWERRALHEGQEFVQAFEKGAPT
jgi:hypothetical protein